MRVKKKKKRGKESKISEGKMRKRGKEENTKQRKQKTISVKVGEGKINK